MAAQRVLRELAEGVLLLTLNRPEKKNAFDHRMWCELRDALAWAQEDDRARSVVVTGAGSAFTAGQDLSEMRPSGPVATEEHGFASFMDRLCAFDKPLIAAVNGVGVGIGLTLLLHCDFVYIARGARLRAPFVTLGVVPEAGSSYLLPALIGYRRAVEVLFDGDFIDGPRAVELGIATALCGDADVVDRAMEHARRLARQPLGSLRWTKRLLLATRAEQLAAARRREDEAFARRVGSPENVEAVRAFFERREADFRDVSPEDAPPRQPA